MSSENNLRLANNKAQDLTVKRLTKIIRQWHRNLQNWKIRNSSFHDFCNLAI